MFQFSPYKHAQYSISLSLSLIDGSEKRSRETMDPSILAKKIKIKKTRIPKTNEYSVENELKKKAKADSRNRFRGRCKEDFGSDAFRDAIVNTGDYRRIGIFPRIYPAERTEKILRGFSFFSLPRRAKRQIDD